MKNWKNILLVVLVVLLALAIYQVAKKTERAKSPVTEKVVVPDTTAVITEPADPCSQISALTKELAEAKNSLAAAEKKVKAAEIDLETIIEKCRLENGIKEKVVVKQVTRKATPKAAESPSQQETAERVVSSYERSEPKPAVMTSVISGPARKTIFCVNLRDMDGASFWPHIAIDAGDIIEGAVLNQEGTGYNISIHTTERVEGLYGATNDGRLFVKASLLDKFGPTIIKMSGGLKGWSTWRTAQLVGEYYIAE